MNGPNQYPRVCWVCGDRRWADFMAPAGFIGTCLNCGHKAVMEEWTRKDDEKKRKNSGPKDKPKEE